MRVEDYEVRWTRPGGYDSAWAGSTAEVKIHRVRRPTLATLATLAACLATATVFGLPACRAPARVSKVLHLAPGVNAEVARHLVLDSDEEFRAFAAASGTQDLRGTISSFERLEPTRPAADYERAYRTVRPYWARAANVLEQQFGLSAYRRDFVHRDSLTAVERWGVALIRVQLDSLVSTSRGGPTPDPSVVAELVAWCEAEGHWRQLEQLHAWLADNCRARGREVEWWRHRRAQIALARRQGDVLVGCQLAGEFVMIDTTMSPARQYAVLDSLQGESRRHGLVDQTARLFSFKATIARRQGRLVLERRLRLQALETWDGVGSSGAKVRALSELAQFFIGLDCWDTVNALVRRVEAHLSGRGVFHDNVVADVALIRVDALIHDGREREASVILETLDPGVIRANAPGIAPRLYRALAYAREAEGRDDEARAYLAEGIDHGIASGYAAAVPPLVGQAARNLVRAGEPDSARRLLAWFDARFPGMTLSPAMRIELLSARSRAEARAGERAAAHASLTRALQTLWAEAHGSDAGAESYLALADPPGLREALLEESPNGPASTYRGELTLRGWVRLLGGHARGEPAAKWDWHSIELAPRLEPGEAHVMFAFVGERLCRWTATARGVSLDTLAGGLADWRRRVSELQEAFAEPGGETRARELLRALARDLLPDGVRANPRLRRLYWSGAGPLAALPLEALDIGSGPRYEPIGSRIETAMLRGADSGREPGREVSVLAAPGLSDSERRLYPGLLPLHQSAAEAEDVRRSWPQAHVLTGAAATEAAVLQSWTDAGLIHIAAHLVRLDEIPYYDFIPIATDSTGARDATLEVADVRQRDLSRCELVVLSTCASGVPYVGRRRVGPSMADAFLDAGARAVLRSLRPVEDGEARHFVDLFLSEWRVNGHDAVAAAHAARLRFFVDGASVASPVAWATWSVAVNVPYRKVTSEPASGRAPAPSVLSLLDGWNDGNYAAPLPARDAQLPQAAPGSR